MSSSRHACLVPHLTSSTPWVDTLQVELNPLPGGALSLRYEVTGDVAGLLIPRDRDATRSDGLWCHTCFELFVAGDRTPGYREFNFSPSGQWQAYAFRTYREGGLLEPASAPEVTSEIHAGRLIVQARLPRASLPPGDRLRIGLSAVLEARDGYLSYWALRHAPGKPDFHHPDTFTLEIDLRNPQP